MSVIIHPRDIFLYFNNFLEEEKAKKLQSFCVVQSIRYIASQTKGHNKEYKCLCFKCRVFQSLISILLSRVQKNILCIVIKKLKND